ncbi:MAG: hypothetical protein J6I64_01490, partial [Lachnospiraceae bacterium]|nr:hypothetical protein [Lachnospiraceae bacterium]
VGRVTYQGSLEGDWQVDCDAGNVKMELAASMDEYNYQVEYDLGTVRIGSQEFNGMSDQVSLFNDARYEAQIQCDVGLVDVSFSQ